jgi:hypothetical protein
MSDRDADRLLKLAAERGNPRAIAEWGDYLVDYGPGGSMHRARAWYEKSAALGDAEGLRGLGETYQGGWPATGGAVPPDPRKALDHYRQAVARGSCKAWYQIGEMFYQGDGVRQSGSEAATAFQKAAECRNAPASLRGKAKYFKGFVDAGKLPPPGRITRPWTTFGPEASTSNPYARSDGPDLIAGIFVAMAAAVIIEQLTSGDQPSKDRQHELYESMKKRNEKFWRNFECPSGGPLPCTGALGWLVFP